MILVLESRCKYRLSLAKRFDCTETIINKLLADSYQPPQMRSFSYRKASSGLPLILFYGELYAFIIYHNIIKIEIKCKISVQFSSVQSLSCVRLFATPWTAKHQASLPIPNSQSLLKLMSIESVMPSNHLILCHPLLLPPLIFPSISVFSNESALCIRWPKYWSFSFSISPSNEHSGLISFRMDWLDLLAVQELSRVFSNTTVQKHQFFGTQLSL